MQIVPYAEVGPTDRDVDFPLFGGRDGPAPSDGGDRLFRAIGVTIV